MAAIPPPADRDAHLEGLTVAPTPFIETVTIRGTAPRGARVTLRILDVTGRVVRTLIDGASPGGPRDFRWDGHDADGEDVSAGVYFVVLRAEEASLVRKIVLTR